MRRHSTPQNIRRLDHLGIVAGVIDAVNGSKNSPLLGKRNFPPLVVKRPRLSTPPGCVTNIWSGQDVKPPSVSRFFKREPTQSSIKSKTSRAILSDELRVLKGSRGGSPLLFVSEGDVCQDRAVPLLPCGVFV